MSNTIAKLNFIATEITAVKGDLRNLESAQRQLLNQFQQEMADKHGIRENDRLRSTKAFRKLLADRDIQDIPKSLFKKDWRFWKYEPDGTCWLIDAKWEHQVRVPLNIVLDMRAIGRKVKT